MTLSEKIQLPLFPLNIFLLPGERKQLHIFEPRYRQLFSDIQTSGAPFGLAYTNGRLGLGYGSRCRLIQVITEFPSGASDVLVECEGLFRIDEFQSMKEDRLYPYGSVTLLRDIAQEICSDEVIAAYNALAQEVEGTGLHFHRVDSKHVLTVLSTIHCSDEEKYRFVKLPSAEDRERVLGQRIELLRSLVSQEKVTEGGFYLS